MSNITALRKNISKEAASMPAPKNILDKARLVEDAPVSLCASDYGEAIHLLRTKGYTWQEITNWFAEHGIEFSHGAIVGGFRAWAKRNFPEVFES